MKKNNPTAITLLVIAGFYALWFLLIAYDGAESGAIISFIFGLLFPLCGVRFSAKSAGRYDLNVSTNGINIIGAIIGTLVSAIVVIKNPVDWKVPLLILVFLMVAYIGIMNAMQRDNDAIENSLKK